MSQLQLLYDCMDEYKKNTKEIMEHGEGSSPLGYFYPNAAWKRKLVVIKAKLILRRALYILGVRADEVYTVEIPDPDDDMKPKMLLVYEIEPGGMPQVLYQMLSKKN